MASHSQRTLVEERQTESLYHALGSQIAEALARRDVVEVMANPDGSLWLDRAGVGRERLGVIEPTAAETAIRLLASFMGESVTEACPAISGVLPRSGERFQGVLPPLAERPMFSIRKRAQVLYTLEDYVRAGIVSGAGAQVIQKAVAARTNILIAGGTGSGKTTLVNAILAQDAFREDRVVILEDTRELQCAAEDRVELLTKNTEPRVTMTDLLKMTLRLRPDRIIVGEVRDGAALAMLKAWNTGHPGGVATLHANSPMDALRRMEELIGEVSQLIPRRSIAAAIGLIVFIERINQAPGRRVTALARVEGLAGDSYQLANCEDAREDTGLSGNGRER